MTFEPIANEPKLGAAAASALTLGPASRKQTTAAHPVMLYKTNDRRRPLPAGADQYQI
jgi:hypothetical protein